MERLWPVLLSMLVVFSGAIFAKPLERDQVPDPLRPWVDWVLLDDRTQACPFLYSDGTERRCTWPTRLSLVLNEKEGSFSFGVKSYLESIVSLPGDERAWPQEVTVDGEPAVVLERDGRPALQLAPGDHEINGRVPWERIPESLAVPADSALIEVTVQGKPIAFPKLRNGRLWLMESDTGRPDRADVKNTLELKVFRKVIDDVPLRLVTRIMVDVAGEPREELLGRALLPGFIPLALESSLPARLEPDGRLRLEVRPGHWQIDLTARHPAPLTRMTLTDSPKPWPGEEIWVFDARTHLRLVEVEGVAAVDPRQTSLPSDWMNLPAFRLVPAETMVFNVIRRGDPDPEPNKLRLQRTLWLDFDGGGYTVNDVINGVMTRDWRLNADSRMKLGKVELDGRSQLVTRMPGSEEAGVEVRRGAIRLNADSRIEGEIGSLRAVGWKQDFDQVGAVLNLPPGWRLFSATGIDNVPDTWLYRWTLLDFFMVMIAALAIRHLWNWRWALLALITLGLIWHQSDAPRYVWLHILAAIALLRVLPAGRLAFAVRFYRNLSLFALAVIGLPFMVDQVRTAIYPQLERPWQQITRTDGAGPAGKAPMMSMESALQEGIRATLPSRAEMKKSFAPPAVDEAAQVGQADMADLTDPDAMVQTGPGLPQWRWTQVPFHWNGPVEAGQKIRLIFLPPAAVTLFKIVGVLLVIALAGLMFTGRPYSLRTLLPSLRSALPVLLLVPMMAFPGGEVRADLPDRAMLEELKSRLLAPPECLPACAQIAAMKLTATPEELRLELEIHAEERVFLPLPGVSGQWEAANISVDGKTAGVLYRTAQNVLRLDIGPGRHIVLMTGALPDHERISLPLPLRPRRVDVKTDGWSVEGIRENGVPEPQLQLSRQRPAATSGEGEKVALEAETLPPFVQVERTLIFGLDWRVATRIHRRSPPGAAVVLSVPLLEGESVVSAGVRVKNGRVLVNMSPGQRSVAWESVLEKRPEILLTAPDAKQWTEVWRADVSPIWHLSSEGIPVVHHTRPHGSWLPEWRPWPGERVTLSLIRPEGVAGRTLTIDASRLQVKPGKRSTDVSLGLTVRSSQGGQHTVTLPPSARLNSVTIDGASQPVRQKERDVTLPIHPGTQQISLNWKESRPLASWFRLAPVDLATESVNSGIGLGLEDDRWVLFAGGPDLGPAVLFWGYLLVIGLLAAGMGRIPYTPLSGRQWFLLLLGLSQIPVAASLVIAGWLVALGVRGQYDTDRLGAVRFNLIQVALGLLTMASMVLLFIAVKQGLLGTPDMQIGGNQSTAFQLNWYQDRNSSVLPRPWIVSVPLLAYQLLMLAWSVWLAFALIRWLKWGWGCYAREGFWRHVQKKQRIAAK